MKVIASAGREDVAMVYVVDFGDGKLVECVESVQPPIPRADKWVLLVSTMFGCPIGCSMCDAGGHYQGKPTKDQIFSQIDFLVDKRYPDRTVPARQFKIQFARMGEPSLNPHVLDVLEELPRRYNAPGLMPSLSSVAPKGSSEFFERLLEIKKRHYAGGHFQFQFSLHTTDGSLRDKIIPVKKWSFAEMSAYGERFYAPGDRKITLNFALAQDMLGILRLGPGHVRDWVRTRQSRRSGRGCRGCASKRRRPRDPGAGGLPCCPGRWALPTGCRWS